jgi:hypothetical protein
MTLGIIQMIAMTDELDSNTMTIASNLSMGLTFGLVLR